MIWLYLAASRSGGKTAKRDLQNGAARLKPSEWPFPVVEFYLGRRTPAAMLAAAQNPDERCEAQFYLGQWQLLQGKHIDSIEALRHAVEACPKDFNEYAGAVAELKRLGQ
jgi:lipoprotein NlpI